MSSQKQPIYVYERTPLGKGSYGKVYLAQQDDGYCYALKCIELGDKVVNPLVLRELHYQNFASRHTFDPVSSELVESTSTGVPHLVRSFVDPSLSNACILQELASSKSIDRIIQKFNGLDLYDLFHSWLVQAMFILATLESNGIMHRDIKPQHLRINRQGSLYLIDWGLATSHFDNDYLTQYVVTYIYRPPEVYYFCIPHFQRCPSWTSIAPEVRAHPLHSSRSKDRMTAGISKMNDGNGPHIPPPYSCESDMFSLGMSLIVCLLGGMPIKTREDVGFYYKQKLFLHKLFSWRGLDESFFSLVRGYMDDPSHPDDLSFERALALHWADCFRKSSSDVMCPFSGLDDAIAKCSAPRTEPLQRLLRKCKKWSRPPWVCRYISTYGPLLLAMCHPNPDKRPKASSLLKSLCQGKQLSEWQRVSHSIVELNYFISDYAFECQRDGPLSLVEQVDFVVASRLDAQEWIDSHPDAFRQLLEDLDFEGSELSDKKRLALLLYWMEKCVE